MMKKMLIAIFVMASTLTHAQSSKQDVALIQSIFGKEKQILVKDYMQLDEAQSAAFWPVYEAYEKERQELVRHRMENIAKYIEKYGDLNEASAPEIMKSIIQNDGKLVNLEGKYLGKMKKAVGGIQATKFFQLENYLRNTVSAKIQEQIPAIDELVQ